MFNATSSSHTTQGRHLVLRCASVQVLATMLAAGVVLAMTGVPAACAALIGGGIVAVGNVLFGFRLFAPGIAPVRVLARAVWVGEVLKWIWVVASLVAALRIGLAPLPLVVGLTAAQIGFWLSLAIVR